jgi:hypothetical protein
MALFRFEEAIAAFKVTRLGEFFAYSAVVYLAIFKKIAEVAKFFGSLFGSFLVTFLVTFGEKYVLIFTGWATFWAAFFANSSGQPVAAERNDSRSKQGCQMVYFFKQKIK